MAIRTALDRIFSRVTPLAGDETYSQEIVGESHYQDALEKIVGGRTEDSAEHYCDADRTRPAGSVRTVSTVDQ